MANPPAAIINSENKTENLTRRPSNLLESTLAAFVDGDNFRHDASLTLRQPGQQVFAVPIRADMTEWSASQKWKPTPAVSARGVT